VGERLRVPVRLGLLFAAALVVLPARAQSVLEFDRWMQQIDRHSQDVLRHIQRRDDAAALADARELAALYRRMEDFYQQRGHADDAVLASFVGRDQAEQAASALASRRYDEAYAQASALARDCRNCHIQYKPMRP
jgi:hypothetical protein